MDVQLTTDSMAQTYCGLSGYHNPCNMKYWDTQAFSDRCEKFRRDEGRRPTIPRLAIETHPLTYGVLAEIDGEPLGDSLSFSVEAPFPMPKDVPPTPMVSEPDSDTWGSWSIPKEE